VTVVGFAGGCGEVADLADAAEPSVDLTKAEGDEPEGTDKPQA
jgi:hypothetical protein